MQFASMIKSLELAIITFSTVAVAAAVDKSTYIASRGVSEEPTYGFSKAVWKGDHNGKYYELEGNVEEVIGQLEVLDPGSTAAVHAGSNLTSSTLSPRGGKTGIICIPVPGQPWKFGNWDAIAYGAQYLESIGGVLCVAAHDCANIACKHRGNAPGGDESGIYLCNDNDFTICPNAAYLGSYADDINRKCSVWVDLGGGQEFDSDNYNVIAKLGCERIP